MCSLRCLENLTYGLVTESNTSSVYYPVGDTTTGLEDSHATMINIGGNQFTKYLVDNNNRKKISVFPSRKTGLHKSPRILSPTSPI